MKNLHFCIGLPRSGSTLVMNILQQNPEIFTSSTSPSPYLIESSRSIASSVSEFLAMDQDKLTGCMSGFLRSGLKGWYEELTNKPTVISKSRVWDQELNTIFNLYKKPKIIVIIRDIRDIICSFEKLLTKYYIWQLPSDDSRMVHLSKQERIERYCKDTSSNLGRPLALLPHIYEWANKYPQSFYIFRIEDFNIDPQSSLSSLYDWLELPDYKHDFNNIPKAEQYEHDTIYRTLVSHKTEPVLRPLDSSHKTMLSIQDSIDIIHNNQWFYQTFYPELYDEYAASIKPVS